MTVPSNERTADAAALPVRGPTAVGLGEMVLGGADRNLAVFGLGSCIGLALWSARQRLGVLCHIVLPHSGGAAPDPASPAKYADWAVDAALAALAARGAAAPGVVAKLAGGARVLALPAGGDIGGRNAAATQDALRNRGIPIRGQSTGGTVGRTVVFHPGSGVLEVRPVGGAGLQL